MYIHDSYKMAKFLVKRSLKRTPLQIHNTLEQHFEEEGVPSISINFEEYASCAPRFLQYINVIAVGIDWLAKYAPQYVWAEYVKHRFLKGK